MINLVGTGPSGQTCYHGITDAASTPGLFIHQYGKKISKPGRKMGHMTLLGPDSNELIKQVPFLKSQVSVCGKIKS
jgi:5-(carboxyamino)imidazole ribonucleotide synthase